jgi:FAD/FMN-containing dehydrogenase
MDKHTSYEQKKHRLQQAAKILFKNKHTRIGLHKNTSNLFRNRHLADQRLDVRAFNQVIHIDRTAMQVEVEAMTTYETLVAETLRYHCLPAVVPELKTITVGGALSGVGIESSSYRYGLVHETVTSMEVLLADGEIVTCTAENAFQDLFFAIPNAYGSLGYVLKLTLKLIPIKPFVQLTHQHFSEQINYFSVLEETCAQQRQQQSDCYIDGVVFSAKQLCLTVAKPVATAPYTSNYRYLHAYYPSIKAKNKDYLSIKDYIWRWDADWFWCSKNFGMQNFLMRLLLGKFIMHSAVYWKLMRFARNNRCIQWLEKKFTVRKETIIQDVEIPIQHAAAFLTFLHNSIGILPIWICPLQAYNPQQHFLLYPLDKNTLYVNFGFWDSRLSQQAAGHYNRLIEEQVNQLQGRKSLYSTVYYTEEAFWQLYDYATYSTLKQKYDPHQVFDDLYTKVHGHLRGEKS